MAVKCRRAQLRIGGRALAQNAADDCFLSWKDYPDEFGVMWNGNPETTTAAITDADRRLFREEHERSFQATFSGGGTPRFKNENTEARCEAGQPGA